MKKYYKAPLVGVTHLEMDTTLEDAIYRSEKTVLMDILVKKTRRGYREIITGKKIPVLEDVPIISKHQSGFEFESKVPKSAMFIVNSPLATVKEYSMKEASYEEFVDYTIEYLADKDKLLERLNQLELEANQNLYKMQEESEEKEEPKSK